MSSNERTRIQSLIKAKYNNAMSSSAASSVDVNDIDNGEDARILFTPVHQTNVANQIDIASTAEKKNTFNQQASKPIFSFENAGQQNRDITFISPQASKFGVVSSSTSQAPINSIVLTDSMVSIEGDGDNNHVDNDVRDFNNLLRRHNDEGNGFKKYDYTVPLFTEYGLDKVDSQGINGPSIVEEMPPQQPIKAEEHEPLAPVIPPPKTIVPTEEPAPEQLPKIPAPFIPPVFAQPKVNTPSNVIVNPAQSTFQQTLKTIIEPPQEINDKQNDPLFVSSTADKWYGLGNDARSYGNDAYGIHTSTIGRPLSASLQPPIVDPIDDNYVDQHSFTVPNEAISPPALARNVRFSPKSVTTSPVIPRPRSNNNFPTPINSHSNKTMHAPPNAISRRESNQSYRRNQSDDEVLGLSKFDDKTENATKKDDKPSFFKRNVKTIIIVGVIIIVIAAIGFYLYYRRRKANAEKSISRASEIEFASDAGKSSNLDDVLAMGHGGSSPSDSTFEMPGLTSFGSNGEMTFEEPAKVAKKIYSLADVGISMDDGITCDSF